VRLEIKAMGKGSTLIVPAFLASKFFLSALALKCFADSSWEATVVVMKFIEQ
jgi:hypothetical protein